MKSAVDLVEKRRKLQREVYDLVDRRSACKTQEERLKLVPEAVRITGEMQQVEDEFEKLTGRKLKERID